MDEKKVKQGVLNKLLSAVQSFRADNPVKTAYQNFASQPIGSGNSTPVERYARGVEAVINAPGARTLFSAPSGGIQGSNFGMGKPLDKALYGETPRTFGQSALANTGYAVGLFNPYSAPNRIIGATNPVLGAVANRFTGPLLQRVASGGLNALQGEAISRSTTGKDSGVLGAGIDFALGATMGPKAFATSGAAKQQAKDAILEKVEETVKKIGFDPKQVTQAAEPAVQVARQISEDNPAGATINTMLDVAQDGKKTAGSFLSKTRGFEDNLRNIWETMVGRSQAAEMAGQKAAQAFTKYDVLGGSVFDVVQKDKKNVFQDLRGYFDTRYKQLKDAGINFRYRENYLPQLWANEPGEVMAKLGKSFSTTGKGPFTLERVFETYAEGKKAGLTPRFEKLSDLVAWYEGKTEQAMAQKQFFDNLVDEGYLLPKSKIPKSLVSTWQAIDPRSFDYDIAFKTADGKKIMSNKLYAPAPLAQAIDNYLKPNQGLGASLATAATESKNRVAIGGVPFTGISAQGHNVLTRFVLSGNNPFARALKGTEWVLNPRSAANYVQKNFDRALEWRQAGLTFATEEKGVLSSRQPAGSLVTKGVRKFDDFLERTFADGLFKKVIPAMKIQVAEEIFSDLTKNGVAREEAMRTASRQANELLGGINYEMIGRDKEFQNLARLMLFAPDWTETQIRLGKGMLESVAPKNWNNPAYKVYRTFARNYMASYASFAALNKALSGHWPWQNEPGQWFNLDTGTFTDDGQKRHVRVYGTATDFIRLPMDVASGIAQGDMSVAGRIVRNRLSTPAGAAVSAVTNTDYLGRPITGEDQYGNPLSSVQSLQGIVRLVAGATLPNPVQEVAALASGNSSAEEAIMNSLELPLRYTGGAFSQNQKEERDALRSEGSSGQEVYNYFQASRDAKKEQDAVLAAARSSTSSSPSILERIFGSGEKKPFSKAVDKRIAKKQRELIGTKIDSGAETSPEELAFYFLDEYEQLPQKTTIEKQEKVKEGYDLALKIKQDTRLLDDNKQYLYESMGIDPKELEYYEIASKDSDLKTTYAAEYLLSNAMQTPEGLRQFIDMRREVAGQQILTDTVINNLRDARIIDPDLADDLKDVYFNPFTREMVFGKKASIYGSKGSGKKARLDTTVSVPGKIGLPDVGGGGGNIKLNKTKLASISGVSKKNRLRLKTKRTKPVK